MNLTEQLAELKAFDARLIKKQRSFLRMESFIGLLSKCTEMELQSKLTPETYGLIQKTYDDFMHYTQENHMDRKAKMRYFTSFNTLIQHVGKSYGLVPRGSYVSTYLGVGIAIGAALGLAFSSQGSSNYAIGISIGLVLGVSIGNAKENKLKMEGKLF